MTSWCTFGDGPRPLTRESGRPDGARGVPGLLIIPPQGTWRGTPRAGLAAHPRGSLSTWVPAWRYQCPRLYARACRVPRNGGTQQREITYDDGIWNPEYSWLLQYRGMELPSRGGLAPSSKAPIIRPWPTKNWVFPILPSGFLFHALNSSFLPRSLSNIVNKQVLVPLN